MKNTLNTLGQIIGEAIVLYCVYKLGWMNGMVSTVKAQLAVKEKEHGEQG